jgi:hypothetical protein
MGARIRQPGADPGANTLKVRHDLIIPEAQDFEALVTQERAPRCIRRCIHMLPTISFDDLQAGEVRDVWAYRVLTAKTETVELALPENAPKSVFRQRHVAPKFACPIPLLSISHSHFL